ncbi:MULTISPECIES: ABC transporter permease [Aeribacillus]|uniref:ABC transporter permease n=1 Tax=Aeribacillus pallidus TaxID=33936 RepID=A0A223E1S4_9BACI|nr:MULTISPECIES: ABC transporter permease [Aeribacillus]ASS89217.1 ABC transporter permease [Aeribacillus pallidus]MDR9794631.1 ABC transporter permease [Aeribacillus pallidus]MDR9797125.1 ABC transporter permease [Aeribacillus pallidus]MED0704072.1 ABC transporter permease [Aeribacillus composti]MED0717304.1 ABC transporter permease [Aeribacillus composti]
MASVSKSIQTTYETRKHIRFSFHWIQKLVKQTAVIILLLLFWEVAPRIGVTDPTFFPPFSKVVEGWWGLVVSGELLAHFQASIVRSFIGFGIALLIAIPLGLLIGWYPIVSDLLNPVLELFRNTAALALLPVFILVFGIGETSKVAIVLFACTFPVLLNTISAVRNVDPLLIKSARSMGLPPYKLFYQVILPASIPTIFTGIRMAGTASILVLIAAEMVGAKEGLGYLINYTQMNFQIPEMYAGIITIAILGFVLNYILVSLEKRFSAWKTNQ